MQLKPLDSSIYTEGYNKGKADAKSKKPYLNPYDRKDSLKWRGYNNGYKQNCEYES